MATFKFELVSPEKLVLSADAEQVIVPGSEGDFGVLVGHAPVVATLRPGIITVMLPGGAQKRIFVRSGFAEVEPSSLTILAQQAVDVADLKPADIAVQIKAAEDDLAGAGDDENRMRAQAVLDSLRGLQAVA